VDISKIVDYLYDFEVADEDLDYNEVEEYMDQVK
jgi:hypothetical protein